MSRVIVLVLISLSLGLTSCKFFKSRGWFGSRKTNDMLEWQARQDSIRVADSLNRVMERMAAMEQARVDSINKAEQERLAREARFKYHIIVGSFITPEYARSYEAYVKSEGYNTRIIKKPDSRFELVSAEAHESLAKAVRRLVQFRDTVVIDAWIYVMR